MTSLHWIRPYWLLALIPWLTTIYFLWQHQVKQTNWSSICDSHLLKHQLVADSQHNFIAALPLIASFLLLIIGLAGPSWHKLPVPTYQTIMPRVILLDMSSAMFEEDIKPSRLFRAKLFIRDILSQSQEGQIALIAYSGMPFVVSPLTQDNHTIETLLSSLKPDIMPIDGHDMADALQEAKNLINQAGFPVGDILVITANRPDEKAILTAENLAENSNINTSILPIHTSDPSAKADTALAAAGRGVVIHMRQGNTDLNTWLHNHNRSHQLQRDVMNHVPLWQDEGHWFILLALLCLLPMFRRGALEALT